MNGESRKTGWKLRLREKWEEGRRKEVKNERVKQESRTNTMFDFTELSCVIVSILYSRQLTRPPALEGGMRHIYVVSN